MADQKEVLEHGIQTYNVNGQKKWKWKVSMSTIDKKNVIQFPLKATPNPNIKIKNPKKDPQIKISNQKIKPKNKIKHLKKTKIKSQTSKVKN